ncbi:hypothetical protein LUZ62_084091 [Rhynchospora pubera]|uniref:Uncharacterized protein n=1 Tax=Rhynchospora pubera TaxID=906938 RepID=A0AAV8C2I6_9POAL|nr:hypothetical protein LUZ62_084091 [Rhynchospora pubera]
MAMGVELNRGFSIRDYVAKTRSIDVGKCRPFDGASLPEMDVRKFRWWSDAAAAAGPSVARQRKPKKKKRSIVELFAISPQITAVGGETNDSDGEMEGSAGARTGEEERVEEVSGGEGLYYADLAAVSKREENESKLQVKNCRGDKSKKMKSNVETRQLQIKICVAQKEKTRKPKITSSLSISQLLQEVKRKKMLRKTLKLSFQAKNKKKKKKKFPSILSKKENNLTLSPKSTPKSKPTNLSVQSILKKQVKSSPLKKHVTFSGKNDIFGGEQFSSSPVELFPVPGTGYPDTDDPTLVQDIELAEEPEVTAVSNESGVEKGNDNSLEKCVDLNKILESSDACIEINEDFARERPELMVQSMTEPLNSCLIDKHQVSHANSSVSLPSTNICSRDLISVSSSTGSNKSTSADTRLNTDGFSNLCFVEDFVGLPLNSQGELAINPNPDFISNSSELFKRDETLPGPLGEVLFPGPVPVPIPVPSPIRPIATASTDQTDVRLGPLYFKDKFGMEHYYAPLMPVRPGFGFMHLPGFERMEIQSYEPLLDPTSKHTNIYQIQNSNSEPTVRLMGKNVSVGKSSKDCVGLNNRSVWVDKGNGYINGDNFPFCRGKNHGLSFSVEPRFNEPQRQVYSHAGNSVPNGYSPRPVPHINPVITHYNGFEYKKSAISQQVLLNSTHCKHSQSRSISFASSSNQADVPQWIQNPRSKTRIPSFASYINPTIVEKSPLVVTGNRPNLTSPFPGSVISFPAFNSGNNYVHSRPCISIAPCNSTFMPSHLPGRPDFASKDKGKVRNKSKYHILRPSDYIKQNNKRLLERDDMLVRPPLKRHFQSDLGSIAKPRGPGTCVGSEGMLDFGMTVGRAANTQVANTKLNELSTGRFSGPVSGFMVKSGPVKLSAGVRHVLAPGPNMDRANPRPIHFMKPLIGGASLCQKSTEEIYRF